MRRANTNAAAVHTQGLQGRVYCCSPCFYGTCEVCCHFNAAKQPPISSPVSILHQQGSLDCRGAPHWRGCQAIRRVACLLEHDAATAASAEPSAAAACPSAVRQWFPACTYTFTTSSASQATRKASHQRNKDPASSALTEAARERGVKQSSAPWTEVVDKESGQIYYWNEQTSKSPASQRVRQAEHQLCMRTLAALAYRCRRLCSDTCRYACR